jgi:purine-cytosine permease-like protein
VRVGFGAWFSALPSLLKVLVIAGIVVASFAIGASMVASTLAAWRYLAEMLSRKGKGPEG